jgi:hypothetical protein
MAARRSGHARPLTGTAMKQATPSHSPLGGPPFLHTASGARPSRSSLLASFLLGALASGGCGPDTQGKLDRFLDDTEEERDAAQQGRDVGGALADVSGTFLFAIAPILNPATPLQFIATNTLVIAPDGSGATLDMVLQPLSLNVGSTTEPREPVGEPIELLGIPVDASGAFVLESLGGPVMVTGEANPITGSDIVADISLMGAIQSEDLMCGAAGGQVTSPLVADLAGSTFGSQRIEDTDPASLPEPLAECPEGVEPLPGDTDDPEDPGDTE